PGIAAPARRRDRRDVAGSWSLAPPCSRQPGPTIYTRNTLDGRMVQSASSQLRRPVGGGWRSPEEARELLAGARSSLALARTTGHGGMVEDLCAPARQAVERAVRAVLIADGVPAPTDGAVGSLLPGAGHAGA